MFAEMNKVAKKWSKDTEGLDYMKLREYLDDFNLWDGEIIIYGYFINKVDSGEAVTVIADEALINMPSHCLELFKSMTPENDEAIDAGKCKLTQFGEYINKKYKNKSVIFQLDDVE